MFKRNKPNSAIKQYNNDVERIQKSYDEIESMKPRMKFLVEKYDKEISTVDMFIMPRITLINDLPIPEDFLCYCSLIGLKVKEVKENTSYSNGSRFYMSIKFSKEVKPLEECKV